MCDFLEKNGMNMEGFILDRGFVAHDVLDKILKGTHNYVIILKSNTYGHTQMLDCFGHRIFWDTHYGVTKTLLGVSSAIPLQIFKTEQDKGYVHLFFDMKNAPERFLTLYQKVFGAKEKAEKDIINGDKAKIPKGLTKYMRIMVDDKGKQTGVKIIHDELTHDCQMKGFYSIATSMPATTEEVDGLYNLRDVSEVTYMIIKSMLGFHVTRGHSTGNILNRLFVCFITTIIRNAIQKECETLGYATNKVLTNLEQVRLSRSDAQSYFAPDDWSKENETILNKFGIKTEHGIIFATEYNHRLNDKEYDQFRYLPEETQKRLGLSGKLVQKKSGETAPVNQEEARTEQGQNQTTIVRKRGRPPGRKNDKTLAREAAEKERIAQEQAMGIYSPPVQKRGRGRPPGRKNDKTLEREAQAAEEKERMKLAGIEPAPKRGRGRPKGRKNDKTIEREKAEMQKNSSKVFEASVL